MGFACCPSHKLKAFALPLIIETDNCRKPTHWHMLRSNHARTDVQIQLTCICTTNRGKLLSMNTPTVSIYRCLAFWWLMSKVAKFTVRQRQASSKRSISWSRTRPLIPLSGFLQAYAATKVTQISRWTKEYAEKRWCALYGEQWWTSSLPVHAIGRQSQETHVAKKQKTMHKAK